MDPKSKLPVYLDEDALGSRLKARVVKSGESFASIAEDVFGDPRVACLLEDLNPQAQLGARLLAEGQALRIPDGRIVRDWASSMGVTVALQRSSQWQKFVGALAPENGSVDMAVDIGDLDTDVLSGKANFEATTAAVGDDQLVLAQKALLKVTREALHRVACALENTARFPERTGALLFALSRCHPLRARQLLMAFGASSNQTEWIMATLKKLTGEEPHDPEKTSVERKDKMMRRMVLSNAVDKLTQAFLDQAQIMVSVATHSASLKETAVRVGWLRTQVEQSEVCATLAPGDARAVVFIATERLRRGFPPPSTRLAVRLLELLGSVLLEVDRVSLEQHLAVAIIASNNDCTEPRGILAKSLPVDAPE